MTRTLSFLVAAKDGLSAKELTDVLSNDNGVMTAISANEPGRHTKKLPPSVWVRLHRALSPFLIEKHIDDQPLLNFFHRQVANVASREYYGPAKGDLHAALADYFEARATRRNGQFAYDKRGLSELTYQLHHSGNLTHTTRLNEILLSLDWMEQKLSAFASPLPLIEDYRAYAPYDPTDMTAAALVGRALTQSAHVLVRDEFQLVPHLLGRLRTEMAPGIDSVLKSARRAVRPPALVPRVPRLTPADSALLWTSESGWETVRALAFSPDGHRIVSGTMLKRIQMWEAATGAPIGAPLESHRAAVDAVAVSPDGRWIVSGSEDGVLLVWDAAAGKQIGNPLEGHVDQVSSVAISPNGLWIVSASHDKTLRTWSLATGAAIGSPIEGHEHRINTVAISPDGRWIVSGAEDRTLRLWDAATGEAINTPLKGHDDSVNTVAISPNGRWLVSGSGDKTLRIWDAATGVTNGTPLKGHEASVKAVAISPDGRWIVSGCGNGTLRLWNASTGRPIGSPLVLHHYPVRAVAISPDGRLIASGSADNTLRMWDASKAMAIGSLLEDHAGEVAEIAISPDGQCIVSQSANGTIRLWDAGTGVAIDSLVEAPRNMADAVEISPDKRCSEPRSFDDAVKSWDATTRATKGQNGRCSVEIPSDGRWIANCSNDKTLRVLNASTGQLLDFFEADAWFECITASHGTLAAGDTNGNVHIFDWLPDEPAKAAWLARCNNPSGVMAAPSPVQPPTDISAAPPEMQVTADQLAGSRFLETYSGRHLFALADGRVYLDGLIAVSSLDHARATLDHMAQHSMDS